HAQESRLRRLGRGRRAARARALAGRRRAPSARASRGRGRRRGHLPAQSVSRGRNRSGRRDRPQDDGQRGQVPRQQGARILAQVRRVLIPVDPAARRSTPCERRRTMKLYINPVSPNSRKPRLVAQHLGLAIEEKVVDLLKGEQRTPEFLAKNPNGMVPVLEDGDFCLWESNAISWHLAAQVPGNSLLPSDARSRVDIARWQSWELAHLQPAVGRVLREKFFKKLFNQGPPDPAQVKLGEEQFARFAAVLNGRLEGRKFLLGESLTVADFTVA